MEEKDLYGSVKALFESLDFVVHGEVKNIDVVAKRNDLMVAIELKKDLNVHLIAQGAKRQRYTDYVYVAIPAPTPKVQRGTVYKDKLYLLHRLGIGLIHVSLTKHGGTAKIIQEPNLLDIKASQHKAKKKKVHLMNELMQRQHDYNIGGTKGKTITAYRLQCLRLLVVLSDNLPHTSKEISSSTSLKNATKLMYTNYYGWFNRVDRGLYQITPQGLEALIHYKDVITTL